MFFELTGDGSIFAFYSALVWMVVKLVLTFILRDLAQSDDVFQLPEVIGSFGMEISLIGLSILIGALITGQIVISGAFSTIVAILTVITFIVACLCYVYFQRTKTLMVKIASAIGGSCAGACPYLISFAWLKTII